VQPTTNTQSPSLKIPSMLPSQAPSSTTITAINQIFVDSSIGNDANNGLSQLLPVKTISKALSIAPTNGLGSSILLANGVYRETIQSPNPQTMKQTGPLVIKSSSGDSSKTAIRCSNSISGSSFQLVSSLSSSISSLFKPSARSSIYMADLTSLGWTATDFLRFREDSRWEQKAAGLNFLVQSSSSSLDVSHNQQQMILSSHFFF
jgi:hypothetical protein